MGCLLRWSSVFLLASLVNIWISRHSLSSSHICVCVEHFICNTRQFIGRDLHGSYERLAHPFGLKPNTTLLTLSSIGSGGCRGSVRGVGTVRGAMHISLLTVALSLGTYNFTRHPTGTPSRIQLSTPPLVDGQVCGESTSFLSRISSFKYDIQTRPDWTEYEVAITGIAEFSCDTRRRASIPCESKS
ncbi:hypothetical protein BDZ97DRAFT_229974 [Flammula alnicola]|nr:hypothetical protein BDZ97DRAFT_229974 [Flammula alnicola]